MHDFTTVFTLRLILVKPFQSLVASAFLFTIVYSIGCDPAQSRNVPGEFSWGQFDEIVRFAKSNYIDPDSIKDSRSYVGAAEAAVRALPTPLLLYPRNYYQELQKRLPEERRIPGKIVEVEKGSEFIVVVPDYGAWEKKQETWGAKERERRKSLNAKARAEEFEKQRKEGAQEQDATEKAWADIGFGRKEFETVIAWIEKNKATYSNLPPNFKGENPYEKDPFRIQHIFFAAANGFLQSMDPHSAVMDMESWQKILKESEDSSFEGIGAMLRGGGTQEVVVETPLPGSPALNAGIRAGDVIIKVDGGSIENLPLGDVVKRIRGPKETYVTLELERKTEASNLSIRIKRGVIVQKSVSSRLESGKIGVIKLSSFLFVDKRPTELIRKEYDSLIKQAGGQLNGLVLDLRGNPGGDLDEAIRIAGLFVPANKVVVQIKRRGDTEERRSDEDPMIPAGLPMLVLINSGSASASEIVASALMDHNAALVLGERSFGKATVQGLQKRGEVLIKLTTARYYAPNGYTIQVYGVIPDIALSDEPDNTFPPRFREEDMWKHLPELTAREKNTAREAWVEKIKAAMGSNNSAEQFLSSHKNDALKPDYMLVRALSYFEALRKNPKPE
ncbi:MAG: S41 family peptidase [Spirochaetia bacterium]|nr:S41 family peptidase [Spirochaetia bacterium]